MKKRNRDEFAALQRRQQVAELYLQGWTQNAIAEHLAVVQSTVSEDLKHVRQAWRESFVAALDETRARELARIDLVETEAWAAWKRSQKPTQSATVTGEGNGQQTRKSMKHQIGDPRFLDQVNKCIAQRRAILGLDAPLRLADVTPPPPEETPEKRKARMDEISRAITGDFEKRKPQRRLIPPKP